jgi:hypothetical protein
MENITQKTIANSVVATASPKGANVISPVVSDYVGRYQCFLRKTAEAILGLAQTLSEAEECLDEVDFAIFLEEIDLEKGSPTYSKLKKIGEALSRFQPYVEKLPNTWTTLYALAKIDPTDFDRVSANLNPFITVKEIQGLLGKDSVVASKKSDFAISLNDLEADRKSELYNELKKLKERFGFNLATSQTLVTELKSLKLKTAA